MKLFTKCKDGGPDSPVTGYFLIEWKRFFSIALLHFPKDQMRGKFHSHAFNALSWVLRGRMTEFIPRQPSNRKYRVEFDFSIFKPSIIPKYTPRRKLHKIKASLSDVWVLTVRGPWSNTWQELDEEGDVKTLTHGRRVITELDI